MDIVGNIKEILGQQNSSKKESKLEQLSDVFEYSHELNETNLVEGVQLLLTATLQESNKGLKESFFHAIDNAIVYQDIGDRINWEMLITALPSLEKMYMEYALNVLGLSGQVQYLPILEKYAHHADPEIRKWAQEAITEIEYRVAHASTSQQHEGIEKVGKLASDMSIELLVFPTLHKRLSWKEIRTRLETLSGSSARSLLGKQPLLRHVQTQMVVGEDESLTPSNHYSFDLAFPNGLALNVCSNKETLLKDLSHFQAQSTLEEYLEQVGQNLVPATIPRLAARWRMIGSYYELTAPAGRSPEESLLFVYLVTALAEACEGYIISKGDHGFLKGKYGLKAGVYTAEEFSRAIPKS